MDVGLLLHEEAECMLDQTDQSILQLKCVHYLYKFLYALGWFLDSKFPMASIWGSKRTTVRGRACYWEYGLSKSPPQPWWNRSQDKPFKIGMWASWRLAHGRTFGRDSLLEASLFPLCSVIRSCWQRTWKTTSFVEYNGHNRGGKNCNSRPSSRFHRHSSFGLTATGFSCPMMWISLST